MKINSYKHHRNGGFEQGILQVMKDEGLLRNEACVIRCTVCLKLSSLSTSSKPYLSIIFSR